MIGPLQSAVPTQQSHLVRRRTGGSAESDLNDCLASFCLSLTTEFRSGAARSGRVDVAAVAVADGVEWPAVAGERDLAERPERGELGRNVHAVLPCGAITEKAWPRRHAVVTTAKIRKLLPDCTDCPEMVPPVQTVHFRRPNSSGTRSGAAASFVSPTSSFVP